MSARHSRLEKIRNTIIRKEMNVKNSVIDYVTYKQLNCYGHIRRKNTQKSLVMVGEEEGVDPEIPGCRK